MIVFSANSSWYLDNFRSNTLDEFHKSYRLICFTPGRECLSLSYDHIETKINPTSLSYISEARALLNYIYNLKKTRPNLVFSFNPKINLYSIIGCALLKIPVVPNISGIGSASELKGLKGCIYNSLLKFFLKRTSYVFFQNSDDYTHFFKKGMLDDVQCEILPGSGVNLDKFTPSILNVHQRRFLMASRLIKPKGVVEYLDAAQMISRTYPDAVFKLAGVLDHSQRSVSESTIVKYASTENIDYLGHRDDMNILLNDVECVVLPSYYPEGTPRSLLEAAAAGKVIITTDTPGCRDVVVEGVNGFLVPPRDTEALKQAMEKVINLTDEKMIEMKANSRKLAEEKFDEQYVIQRYLDVAEKILAQKSEKQCQY